MRIYAAVGQYHSSPLLFRSTPRRVPILSPACKSIIYGTFLRQYCLASFFSSHYFYFCRLLLLCPVPLTGGYSNSTSNRNTSSTGIKKVYQHLIWQRYVFIYRVHQFPYLRTPFIPCAAATSKAFKAEPMTIEASPGNYSFNRSRISISTSSNSSHRLPYRSCS